MLLNHYKYIVLCFVSVKNDVAKKQVRCIFTQ
jgi:hypothetical protein